MSDTPTTTPGGAAAAGSTTGQLRPAVAIGLSVAALAGLIVPAGATLPGLDRSARPSAVEDINTTCCPDQIAIDVEAPTL